MGNRTLWILALPLALGCKSESKTPPPPANTKTVEVTKPVEKPVEEKPVDPPAAVGGKGTIKGVVTFKGEAPKPNKIDMKKDPKCVEINKGGVQPTAVINDGKLGEVFVHIVEGLPDQKWETRTDKIELDQVGCVYNPRMIGIQVKQKLSITNSDATLHNVHAHAKRSEFNQAMPLQGSKLEKSFKSKDLEANISCDAHPWMTTQLRIVEHPYFAVSMTDGTFKIENVPAGKYKVELEHAKLGKKTVEVEVTDGGMAEANAEFGG